MTRRNSRIVVPALMCAALAWTLPARVDAQVQACAEKMQPISDGRLQRAIDALKSKNPGLDFQSDEYPCRHARATISALTRTLGRNYLTRASGYEFAKIVNRDGYFTVERFTSRTPGDLAKLDAALQSRPHHKLAVEANTIYKVFAAGESLILMISSARGYDANSRLFQQIQQSFESPVRQSPHKP